MFRATSERGFSLIEALVALAIAALLTAALTRLVVTTRINAVRIGERTEMTVLAATLMARTSSLRDLHPGRTDGRRGVFAWHVDIAPASFTARMRQANEKRASASGDSKELQEAGGAHTDTDNKPKQPAPPKNWATYRVTVVIEAQSGQTYALDAIRIGTPEADDR